MTVSTLVWHTDSILQDLLGKNKQQQNHFWPPFPQFNLFGNSTLKDRMQLCELQGILHMTVQWKWLHTQTSYLVLLGEPFKFN